MTELASLVKWDNRFLDLAAVVASWSKDPSTQCGAVIVRPNKSIASVGFNGFPRGMSDAPELYLTRAEKYARVVHAEMNAVLSAMEPLHGYTCYITHPPCDRCCVHLIQAGLGRVVWPISRDPGFQERWGEALDRSRAYFHEAGVELSEYEREPHAGPGGGAAEAVGRGQR
jgi:dCMP deaminase